MTFVSRVAIYQPVTEAVTSQGPYRLSEGRGSAPRPSTILYTANFNILSRLISLFCLGSVFLNATHTFQGDKMLQVPGWDKTIETESWRQTLNGAADLIEKHGLTKWIQRDSTGSLCVHGALNLASGRGLHNGLGKATDDTVALYQYLKSQGVTGICLRGCAYWNNRSERTQSEVVHALREAAKIDKLEPYDE